MEEVFEVSVVDEDDQDKEDQDQDFQQGKFITILSDQEDVSDDNVIEKIWDEEGENQGQNMNNTKGGCHHCKCCVKKSAKISSNFSVSSPESLMSEDNGKLQVVEEDETEEIINVEDEIETFSNPIDQESNDSETDNNGAVGGAVKDDLNNIAQSDPVLNQNENNQGVKIVPKWQIKEAPSTPYSEAQMRQIKRGFDATVDPYSSKCVLVKGDDGEVKKVGDGLTIFGIKILLDSLVIL